jgi:hypothetical protein
VEQAKVGILFASLVAAAIGFTWLLAAKSPVRAESSQPGDEQFGS